MFLFIAFLIVCTLMNMGGCAATDAQGIAENYTIKHKLIRVPAIGKDCADQLAFTTELIKKNLDKAGVREPRQIGVFIHGFSDTVCDDLRNERRDPDSLMMEISLHWREISGKEIKTAYKVVEKMR